MESVVLGLNAVYHESSAALVIDGKIAAFGEEERFTRHKHAKSAEIRTTRQLPIAAIKYCLENTGIKWSDLTHVAYSFDPSIVRATIDEPLTPRSWGTPEGDRQFLENVRRAPQDLAEAFGADVSNRFHWVPHELAHAASAYYPSGFESAAVLSLDGIGEGSCGLLGLGTGTSLKVLEEIPYPHSVGFVWEKFSRFLGFSEYEAAKTMALAAFGDPAWFADRFEELVRVGRLGFEVDASRMAFRVNTFDALESRFGPRTRNRGFNGTRDAGIAASLQYATEKAVLTLAERLRSLTGSVNLCIAGGVGLNCVANGKLAGSGIFENIFVQPVAHDAGTAWGAALHVTHALKGVVERSPIESPFLGPEYSSDRIDAALDSAGIACAELTNPPSTVASLVAGGNIGGWFCGPAEIGPRALGGRSIIADPRRPGSRELINLRVKRREHFRPFAPSVLSEHAAEWFDLGVTSISTEYMSFALPVALSKRSLVPAILHVDGTSRLQSVDQVTNRRYHDMISAFYRLTGVPMVLNTSFNTFDEPIVLTPEDAIATFLRTGLDFLLLDGRLVARVPFTNGGRVCAPNANYPTRFTSPIETTAHVATQG